MKKILRSALFAALFVTVFSLGAAAQEMMKKEKEPMPVVAVVRADWCPYCKKIEGFMPELMKQYEGKLEFVVFDITDDAATARSMELAEAKGLSAFFADHKRMAATVAIIKNDEITFKASKKTDRESYEKAFAKAAMK
jgi:thiol-disulfide isomerase/thioredoxin